ncbi:hypothetical protein BV20DRAFT_972925 [Pilatotrama ljubarskyi]|nr:hypothetical protein BV20DRAFT_972925 [Pilatotrama ljubarskyi]
MDGGYTGCSLSLVSTQVRAVSSTTRFHSVSLIANPRRLQSFVALYQRECDRAQGSKPFLRHLYVAFPRLIWQEERARRRTDGPLHGRRRSLSPCRARYRSDTLSFSKAQEGERSEVISSPLPSASSRGRPLPKPPAPYYSRPVLTVSPAQSETSSVDPTESPEYLEAARTLFRLAGPDLLSLAVQCGFSIGGRLDLPFLAQPFALLREAAFLGISNPRALLGISNPRALLVDDAEVAALFPAATHLYIVPYGDLHLPFWSEHAPGVTHLGVSQAQAYINQIAPAIGVADEYVRYLRSRSSDWQWDIPGIPVHASAPPEPELPFPPPPRTYPSVRYLIMEPSASQLYMCGNGYMDYTANIAVLTDMGSKAGEGGVTVAVLPPPKYSYTPYADDCARMRRSWIERMEGKAGVWDGLAAK